MTSLAIGLGIGACIPVTGGDIPVVPVVVADPPKLSKTAGQTIEIEFFGEAGVVTVGGTGVHDGSYGFQRGDLLAGPVYLARPPVPAGGTTPGDVLVSGPGLLIHRADRPVTIMRQWLRDDVPIPGETATAYTLADLDRGRTIALRETATDADGSRTATSDALVVPAGIAPAVAAAPAISGTPQVGQTLTAADGTWTGTMPITFARQWRAAGEAILGATGATYAPAEGDVGRAITCTVTASNAAGSASATSAATAAVTAAPMPSVQAPVIVNFGPAEPAGFGGTTMRPSNVNGPAVVLRNTDGTDSTVTLQLTHPGPAPAGSVWGTGTNSVSTGVSGFDGTLYNNVIYGGYMFVRGDPATPSPITATFSGLVAGAAYNLSFGGSSSASGLRRATLSNGTTTITHNATGSPPMRPVSGAFTADGQGRIAVTMVPNSGEIAYFGGMRIARA